MKTSRTLLVIALLLCVSLASAEIHRAKQVQKPKTVKTGRSEQFAAHDLPADQKTFIAGGHSRETWIYSLFSAVLVGLSGIFPLLVIPLETGKSLRKGAPAARLKLLLSFAVGGLLGDVFLHLLPEAWMNMDQEDHTAHISLGLWILVGILTFLIIEKMFPDGEDEDDEEHEEIKHPIANGHASAETTIVSPDDTKHTTKAQKRKNKKSKTVANGHPTQNGRVQHNGSLQQNGTANGHITAPADSHEKQSSHIKTSGWLNLMANVIDNFTHGLAVAGSFCISTKSGVLTTIIILLHEIPHEVGDFAILLRSGFDRWKAAKAQLLTATGGVLGALAALLAESAQEAGNKTAWILPFTSGGFIYIALVTVVPELLKETDPKESLKQVVVMVSGILVMASVALFLDEHDLPSLPFSMDWLTAS